MRRGFFLCSAGLAAACVGACLNGPAQAQSRQFGPMQMGRFEPRVPPSFSRGPGLVRPYPADRGPWTQRPDRRPPETWPERPPRRPPPWTRPLLDPPRVVVDEWVEPPLRRPRRVYEAVPVPAAGPERPRVKQARRTPPPPKAAAAPPRGRLPRNVPAAASAEMVADEVLFETRGNVAAGELARIARQHRLTRISSERIDLLATTLHRYRITDRRPVASVTQALLADARIASAAPNHIFRLAGEARGSMREAQYAAAKLELAQAHGVATGADVLVAVIDSGVDRSHPELTGAVAENLDTLGGAAAPHLHGTAVAGIIAAGAQLAGVAPKARILAIRAFAGPSAAPGAEGTTMHLVRALNLARQRGARLVNMSFAGPRDEFLARALAAGDTHGMIFVAAVGNRGRDGGPLFPASDPRVLAVTATDADDRLYPQASRGAHISVAAPGVDVLVAAPAGAYRLTSGTSMAAAHVSGAVALLLEAKPALQGREVREVLAHSALDLGDSGPDPDFGPGLLRTLAALARAKGAGEGQGPSARAAPPLPQVVSTNPPGRP